ncbi:ECF transporter S component [Candidatus Bathyarchaeota archaeon]|nr:MAG: ECF transporter S component [Candidatus Bathyarchaeota archaeon]
MPKGKASSSLRVAVAAIFTSFVCVATIVFSVYIPSTKGYFNIGESMVFLSALLFGPYVGAFSGGVGSMLADLILNYPHYAPATLLIKASEGFVVGFLSKHNPKIKSKIKWKAFTVILGIIVGGLLMGIGSTKYSGESELTLGFTTYILTLPREVWLVLGGSAAILISLLGLIADPRLGWAIFSVTLGGLIMVLGYFIYEMFFLGWLFGMQVYAIAEVPANIGQMIIGALVAIPVAKMIRRMFPQISGF